MTGLRFGDLAGLTVDRVNFIRKALIVDRQWTADGFGPPKSSTSYRDTPLGEVAVRALADHLGTHPALDPEGIVFHTGARPLSRKRVHEIWRRALSAVDGDAGMAAEGTVGFVSWPSAGPRVSWMCRSRDPGGLH
jgi:integrase